MEYVTGFYALNHKCSLKTTGDWHNKSYPLEKAKISNSNNSVYKEYGIEEHNINNKKLYIANHIRAILDLLENGDIDVLYGFYNDFIVVNDYDKEIFENVIKLKNNKNWDRIDKLMGEEFLLKWLEFKKRKCI